MKLHGNENDKKMDEDIVESSESPEDAGDDGTSLEVDDAGNGATFVQLSGQGFQG